MVIGNIVGSGVYKGLPMAAEMHSSGWVLICWVLAGIISLFGALCNAELQEYLRTGRVRLLSKIYNQFSLLFSDGLFIVIRLLRGPGLCFSQSLNSIVHLPPVLTSWAHLIFSYFIPSKISM
jgi:APA family basic amino acid/polyamine antiporter